MSVRDKGFSRDDEDIVVYSLAFIGLCGGTFFSEVFFCSFVS